MSVLRKTAQWVSLRLPTATLVNQLHRTIVRPGARFPTLIKSEKYREWLVNAGRQLELQNPACVQGYFGISIGIPHKSRGDLDGYLKATLDLLQAHGVIDNDRFCQRILIQKSIEEEMTVSIVATKQVAENADAAAAMGTLQGDKSKARRSTKASNGDDSSLRGASESHTASDNSRQLAKAGNRE